MSTSINNLRRLAERDVKDHTALFDLYVTVGRDIDYLAIKFGIDPDDLINLLEGYGEKLRITASDVESNPALATAIMEDTATARGIEEFGIALDYSGKGRYKKLSRMLIEEYVEQFYPGIASENPENDWICLEAYLDQKHPGWKGQIGQPAVAARDSESDSASGGNAMEGQVHSSTAVSRRGSQDTKDTKRKVRNKFRLY